jgi:GT2 family glycosyltransferase
MDGDPELDAVIGSYDDSPAEKDVVSQYRNLRQCFVHHCADSRAWTFWTGCGAIRRSVFLAQGGFDEGYGRPSIEDIELGYRLSEAQKKLALDKAIQVQHLKRWTLFSLLRTDVMDRGIPWTQLILQRRKLPNDLNVGVADRLSTALSFALVGLISAGAVLLPTAWLLAAVLLVLACLVLINRKFYAFFAARAGRAKALTALPLHVLYHLSCGISFGAGVVTFLWQGLRRSLRTSGIAVGSRPAENRDGD